MKKAGNLIGLLLLLIASSVVGQQKKGWKSLFDGKTLNGWKQVAGTAEYIIEEGAITGVSKAGTPNTFLISDKEYSDFVLELEVKIDNAINSGIQFRSHYDPQANKGQGRVYGFQYELDPSSRKWTGGIYDEARRGWQYPLTLNLAAQAAFKPDIFNSVRIEAIGHTVKTWINGQPASYVVDTLDAAGVIALQVHSIGNESQAGKKIHWKNIRIKTENLKPTKFPKEVYIVNNRINHLTEEEKAQGFKLLYNGYSPEGWRSVSNDAFPEKGWEYKDGVLHNLPSADPSKHRGAGGDIVTIDKYGAFDLSLEYNISRAGNSGLKYFVANEKGSSVGLEFQILDDKLHGDSKGGKDGNHKSASLYDLLPAKKNERFEFDAGKWNRIRLVVYPDNRVEHYLNGMKVVEYVKGSAEFKEWISKSKYASIPGFAENSEGYLLLQDHGNEVSFRSIKIRSLK